jgi:hypothetical protein
MPSPHAGFAAVTLVSEGLMNQCLQTYLNTYLTGVKAQIRRTVPTVVFGSPLRFRVSADAALTSVRAQLKPNAQGSITLVFRFCAVAQLDVLTPWSPTVLATYNPEIAIDARVSALLIASLQGDQYQFNVNMAATSIDSISVAALTNDLPPEYNGEFTKIIESAETRAVLNTVLKQIAAHQLSATPATVPSAYHYSSMKPVQPTEVWFDAHINTGRLVWRPLNGVLAVAIDVPGYTNGAIQDLHDFRTLAPNTPVDLASVTNLDFIQGYLANAVLPQMRNAFVRNNFRINKIHSLEFRSRVLPGGPVHAIHVAFECSFWTHDFLHFVFAGSTEVDDVEVTMECYPRLYGNKIEILVGKITADLPDWLDVALLGLSLVLPPVSLFLPSIVSSMVHNALVDVANKLNGASSQNGLLVEEEFDLPGTAGPRYRFSPRYFWINGFGGQRFAIMGALLRPVSTPRLRVAFEDQAVAVQPMPRFEIRRDGGLPQRMEIHLDIPAGLVQIRDPTLRVRFETYLNDKPVPAFTRDLRYFDNTLLTVSGVPVLPRVLVIDTIRMVNPNKLDQEVRIFCRLYRASGGATEDLFTGSVFVLSIDPRPDSVKPYVQWAHRVSYHNGFKQQKVIRRSKIHKVPGKGGCRFSNQYLLPGMSVNGKFVSLRRFTGLPFDMIDIQANRHLVCPYCFFGGPDKTLASLKTSKYDLTGAVGKLFANQP